MRNHRVFLNLIRRYSKISVKVIKAPIIEKNLNPKSNGHNDKTMLKIKKLFNVFKIFSLFVITYIRAKSKTKQVAKAVRRGEKLAYPNGVKLK